MQRPSATDQSLAIESELTLANTSSLILQRPEIQLLCLGALGSVRPL